MWRLVVAVVMLGGVRGCETVNGTLLEPLESPGGRYVLRWCREKSRAYMERPQVMWESSIDVDSLSPDQCHPTPIPRHRRRLHSVREVLVAEARCSPTCMMMTLDLMYAGCYIITHSLYDTKRGYRSNNVTVVDYIPVNNTYSFGQFNNSVTIISADSFQKDVHIKIHFGSIPVLNYSLELLSVTNSQAIPGGLIVSNCTMRSSYLLECVQSDLPPGHYELKLEHGAPWVNGEVFIHLNHMVKLFEHTTSRQPPELWTSRTAQYVWPSVAGLLLVMAVCGAGWLLWRQKTRDRRRKNIVIMDWRNKVLSDEKETQSRDEEDAYGPILLLYARDAEPFMDAMVLLRELLAEHTGCKVYDLVEASTIGELAPAPVEWLQKAVSDPRVRLVLVETPAAQHLYCGAPGPDRHHEPLLPARALYRRPDYCDTLLQYALRLARGDALQPNTHYHKYYVVTLRMLPAEVVPTVAPYRRYQLPQHAATLVQDLAPGRPAASNVELQQRLSSTLDRFSRHARDNPHYLRDELTFL